jgi:microcin C transport system permease protein
MLAYIIRRLFLIVPTLIGIMVVNFVIVQFAPGGPVERVLAELQGTAVDATARISGGSGAEAGAQRGPQGGAAGKYRGAQGLDPEFIKRLEKQFGFDKPAHERFLLMMRNYLTFDFGDSFFRGGSVIGLIIEKMADR